MTKNIFYLVVGVIVLFEKSYAFLGLTGNFKFGQDIAINLRSITASYNEMINLVDRIENAKKLVNIDSITSLKNNLQIIRNGLQDYRDFIQKFAGYITNSASNQASQIVADLNAEFVAMPTLLGKIRTAMGVVDTLTKSTLVTYLPADGDVSSANTIFTKILTSVTGLIGKTPMSSSIILATLIPADLSTYTTFINNQKNLAAQQVDQFKNILKQFTTLRDLERKITTTVNNLINFKNFNTDVANSIRTFESRMNDALNREVKSQRTVASQIERKLNASSKYDDNNKIPEAVTNLNSFLTKLDASALEATTTISAAMVVYQTFAKGLQSTSKADSFTKELLTAVSLRVFSKANVLAISCTEKFETQFVKALKDVGTENTACLKDGSSILTSTNNFFKSKLDLMKALITDKFNYLLDCIQFLTPQTSKTRALSSIDVCLTTGATAMVSAYTEIQTVITAMSNQVKNDLTTTTTDYGKCSTAANTFYTGNFTKNLALFDTCSTYTGA